MLTQKNILSIASLLVFSSWMQGIFAAEVDFLKELEAEAEQISQDHPEPAPVTKGTSNTTTIVNPSAQIQLTEAQQKNQKEFEEALKHQLPGTYKLYMRLSGEQRLVVVEAYITNDKKMAMATRQLFNLYFNE